MITRETDSYLDIYPFVDSVDELPSVRVSVYKFNNEVSYHGNVYSREDFDKLKVAFEMALDAQERYTSTTKREE